MGSRSVNGVYLHGVASDRALAAICKRLAADGFDRVTSVRRAAKGDVHLVLRRARATVLVDVRSTNFRTDERADAWLGDEWAAYLSNALGVGAIALFIAEGGYGTQLARFERGDEAARFAIDEDAAATRKQRFVVAPSVLGPEKRKAKVVVDVDEIAIAEQLGGVLGVPPEWLNPYTHGDVGSRDQSLVFRRRATVPVLPERRRRWTGYEREVMSYRARDHAVGVFAFDATVNLESVSEHLSAFLRAFSPQSGLMVRAGRGDRSELLGARFTRTSSIRASQLARGGTLELSAGDLEPFNGRCMAPLFWIESKPAAPEDDADVAQLRFGVTIGRPGADAPERAIAHALRTLGEACVELEGCIEAIITAQGPPVSLSDASLPYQTLAGTETNGARASWLRSHVRSPGWLVLVPSAAARSVAPKRPNGVAITRVRSGLLACVDTPTPHAMDDTERIERWLLPVVA